MRTDQPAIVIASWCVTYSKVPTDENRNEESRMSKEGPVVNLRILHIIESVDHGEFLTCIMAIIHVHNPVDTYNVILLEVVIYSAFQHTIEVSEV